MADADDAAVFRIGGFILYANFDSGNLSKVEGDSRGKKEEEEEQDEQQEGQDQQATASQASSEQLGIPSYSLWTRPDCQGTEFENGNRTWFFFGVRHDPAIGFGSGTTELSLTVRNLNKQSKLFSQGMAPVVARVALKGASGPMPPPPKSQSFERLRDRPTYFTEEGQFGVTFKIEVEPRAVTFVAFTYPYTYKELQTNLLRLERKYSSLANLSHSELIKQPSESIYFVRECLTKSLEDRRVDLLTITSPSGALSDRETIPFNGLFPKKDSPAARPFKFNPKKKTIFISARVHPGETQASFVFNGFVRFLLRENDPRSVNLRSKFVFKLIPMLNPDGVVKGHYRTDSRGVNLNRVYGEPNALTHPTIYAAKKLLLFAHRGYEVVPEAEPEVLGEQSGTESSSSSLASSLRVLRSTIGEGNSQKQDPSSAVSPLKPEASGTASGWYEMTETSRCSEGDESIADFSVPNSSKLSSLQKGPTSFAGAFGESRRRLTFESTSSLLPPQPSTSSDNPLPGSGGFSADLEGDNASFDAPLFVNPARKFKPKSSALPNLPVSATSSSVFLYVDIHGHASKRGIFMYGNHFRDMETKIDSMLLPKLMSLNCANFDFPACNFTEKNMFMKDRHTGAGREGSGRVSAFRATGLVYSYTLEANFNTGRVVNSIATASKDAGCATPPPIYDLPPKYDMNIYEDSGKAMAVSILDLTECNPWTRLTCSPCKNIRGVKDAIRRHIKQGEELARQKEAAKEGSTKLASPRRTPRGLRTVSSSSLTPKAKRSNKLKALPTSPDSYRPVSKIPRKSSVKNSQGVGGLRRAHSIPTGVGSGVSAVGLVATSSASIMPAIIEQQRTASDAASSSSSQTSSATSIRVPDPAIKKLTRSQSQSLPSSQTTSPRQGIKKVAGVAGRGIGKKKKKKRDAGASSDQVAVLGAEGDTLATSKGKGRGKVSSKRT